LQENLSEKEAKLEKLQAEIRQLNGQSNSTLNELQKHETLLKRNKDTYEQMKVDIRNKTRQNSRSNASNARYRNPYTALSATFNSSAPKTISSATQAAQPSRTEKSRRTQRKGPQTQPGPQKDT
jgi:chromosome segregation ATPase